MTTGGFFGGIVGGVIGWFVGGPYGALVGASFGFGIGMMIDPLTPDTQSPGQPQMAEFVVPTSDEGLPLPDLVGQTKCTGNIIWYGADRAEAIYTTTTTEGGKGGGGSSSTTQQTGWKYYSTWAMGLCIGEVNKLYTVYRGEDVVWNGEIELTPGSNDVNGETITLTDMGSMTFYFGTANQVANSTITALLDDATLNPAYRNQCYVVFNDNLMGENSNRVPSMRFVIGKFPSMSWTDKEMIGLYDYNPAAAAYYTLVNMAGLPSAYMNETTFSGAAYTLWQESLGISCFYQQHTSVDTYLSSIVNHVVSIIKYSHAGKFDMKLLRKDTELYEMLEVDESIYLDKPIINRASWIDTLNEIKLSYSLRIFVTECVLGAPTLSANGQTSSSTCEGEASYSVSLGCPPLMLQKTSGGGEWIDVMTVDSTFTWLHTPTKCASSAVSIRIKDVEGQTSNTIVLGTSCTCAGTTLVVGADYLDCSQSTSVTISGADGCCDYEVIVESDGGSIEQGISQTGTTTWTFTVPDGIGAGGTCCLDDYALLQLYCCGNLLDTHNIDIGTPVPIIWSLANPTEMSPGSTEGFVVQGGKPPFHWTTIDSYFNWAWTKTYDRTNYLTVGIPEGCSRSTLPSVTDACNSDCTGSVEITSSADPVEYDTDGSIENIGINSSGIIYITDGVSSFTWSVAGTGFWFDAGFTITEIETVDREAIIYTDGSACGAGTITVTDCNGDTSGVVRAPGSWKNYYQSCIETVVTQGTCIVGNIRYTAGINSVYVGCYEYDPERCCYSIVALGCTWDPPLAGSAPCERQCSNPSFPELAEHHQARLYRHTWEC